MPSWSDWYAANATPHCLSFDWQPTALACLLTRCSVGSNIAINNAMTAITTKSSISVKPFVLRNNANPISGFFESLWTGSSGLTYGIYGIKGVSDLCKQKSEEFAEARSQKPMDKSKLIIFETYG